MAASEEADLQEHLKHVRSGSIASLYLLHGEEDFLQDEFWGAVEERLTDPDTSSFNLEKLDGETCSATDVINAVETLPFLGERKCVLVRRAHLLEEEAAVLAPHFANPHESSCIVLLSGPLKASSGLLKAVRSGGAVISTPPLKGNRFSAAVKRLASRENLSFDDDALSLLIEQTGGSLRRAAAEIEKVGICKSGEDNGISAQAIPVSRELVADIVDDGRTDNLFHLTDAIGARNPGRALAALEVLLRRQNHPTVIVAAMARHLVRLLEARSLLDAGMSTSAVPKKMYGSPYYTRKLAEQARRFSDGELRSSLGRLHRTDIQLRGSGLPDRFLMERVIFELCGTQEIRSRRASAATRAPGG